MIRSVNEYPMSAIFATEQKIKYVIPRFQRAYQWRKKQWEALFNDISENGKNYFLGTIITINQGLDALKITPLEVIDGQQRLATISLLYAAIYYRFLQEKRTEDEIFTSEKVLLKNRLIQKNMKDQLKIELSYTKDNIEDYKAILNELKLYAELSFKKPLNLGNRRLYKTFQYFKKRLSELSFDEILDFLELVNSAVVVKIEVESHADAFILFESVNNRGIPLSAMDIIKNKLLAKIEKEGLKSVKEANDAWILLIDDLVDYSIQERFLRQFYNAFRYKDEVKVKAITRATRSTLIDIYYELIKTNVKFIFNELIEKSKIYNKLVVPKDEGEFSEYYHGLIDLQHIGGAPSYTLLLYLFSEHKASIRQIKLIIEFLVKYFVRRNLTDFPNTRTLDQIFIDLIKKCEENKGELDPDLVIRFLTQPTRFKSINDFENFLKGDIYKINSPVTRFILIKIEEKERTRETFVDFWKRNKKKNNIWTIEHIFPKGKNIPKEWVEMIAEGDEGRAKELQESYVHKLGNLTLTGYNPNLSNYNFQKKKDRKDKDNKNVGYKNGLYLNNQLCTKDSWTVADIKKRTQFLVQKAIGLFSIKGELSS